MEKSSNTAPQSPPDIAELQRSIKEQLSTPQQQTPQEAERALRLMQEHAVIQDIAMGYSYAETAKRHELDLNAVVAVVQSSPYFTRVTPSMRRHIALARIDAISRALMARCSKGELAAINAYIKLQEREAKLAGMDQQKETPSVITINIPWISKDRLSYKHEGEVVENVTDITPILDVKRAAAGNAESDG